MKRYSFLYLLCCSLMFACKEDKRQPINQDSAPGPVSNVTAENIAGGARITYNRPKDESLLYVKAVYNIREGVQREVKASYYQNTLTVDGFPDTVAYTVTLYAVSRGEKASAPVTVTIHPLTPPVKAAFETLEMTNTYGGVRVTFVNDAEADLVLTVLATDSTQELVPAETYYTKRKAGAFAARGFDTTSRKFGVYVRDRWNNHSDTLFATLKPMFEQKLDKSKFKEVDLPTDTYQPHIGKFNQLWDDKLGGNIFHTKPGTGLPQWFTIDLGVKTTLSRFKLHHRDGTFDGPYTGGDPKIYEIWGSNNPPSDGSWNNWELLSRFESVKPSGLPEGTVTTEDKQFAVTDGEDFDFPPDIPPVRYIRFKTIKVWGALDHMYIAELTFWGNVK
ncbi:hypothetical protein J2T02_002681 [Chitinophaga terrae (ex Kim and Jung 2007)]|uniref:DUF5000 domain-containing lipoprotein n=1 Tax=Chitinophaga terrae (ex Kim and Jung 2007) TaxID=408074 RepID=UPI00278B10E3|nr:DUF5000 domain-containing lipoprotein [Chitinophaga terrae (ex Kim and Jung 2007)]MDQ0107562.1 hypothetical protein [Chitinophaga terrae (ex Kim and Jung 2007)]